MAGKIRVAGIIKSLNDLKQIGFKFPFAIESKSKNSKVSCDFSFSSICQHYLPMWIAISCEYYKLDGEASKLSNESIGKFNKIKSNLTVQLSAEVEAPTKKQMKVFTTIDNRFRVDVSKREFFDKNSLIQNDNHRDHVKAFDVSSVADVPKNNILMKLTDGTIHLRLGIEVISDKFIIIRIVNKKDAAS